MRLEKLLIGIAVFIIIISVGVSLLVQQVDYYNVPDADSTILDELLNQTDGFVGEAQDLEDVTSDVKDEPTEESVYKANIPTIKSIFGSVTIATSVLGVIAESTGLIPQFVINMFILILIVLAGVFVMYMLARFKPQD